MNGSSEGLLDQRSVAQAITKSKRHSRLGTKWRADHIPRRQLMKRLAEAACYPIVCIVAPAGFGKSTALRQHLEVSGASILINVPQSAHSLADFISVFASCCAHRFPEMASGPSALSDSRSPSQQLDLYVAWAISNLRSHEIVLAFDDLQHLDADQNAATFLSRVVDECKESVRFIFVSRSVGHLPHVRWQAYGEADAIVNADDLRMSLHDARELAKALGSGATESELVSWVAQTRGFLVPLTYAIRRSVSVADKMDIMDGARSVTFQFLAMHLWQNLTPDDRDLLHLAALLPALHTNDYEHCNVKNATTKFAKLSENNAFVSLNQDFVFSMHDLFRDFVNQQLLMRGVVASSKHRSLAVSILFKTRHYEDAFELLINGNDENVLTDAIEEFAHFIVDASKSIRLVEVADKLPLNCRGVNTLCLQTNYYFSHEDPKALHCAEEILLRNDAESRHILIAIRAIGRFTHLQEVFEHRLWCDRLANLTNRLTRGDRIQALAHQALFFSRYPELRSKALALVSEIRAGLHELEPQSRLATQSITAVALFFLGDMLAAAQLSREANVVAQKVGDVQASVQALNTLGMTLYYLRDPEFLTISEKLRPMVEKTGAWRYSQVSHWMPTHYFAWKCDLENATSAENFHRHVIPAQESQSAQLVVVRLITDNLRHLIAEEYDEIISSNTSRNYEQSCGQNYHLLVNLGIAFAFSRRVFEAKRSLERARLIRESLSQTWEDCGNIDVLPFEIVALVLSGQLKAAVSLTKSSSFCKIALSLQKALVFLCDGPPFTTLLKLTKSLHEQPYLGLCALMITRAADRMSGDRGEIKLTAAEDDVLRLLSLGKSNKEIAAARSRSAETVKRQVAGVFRKLGVENRTTAIAIARERGLL